MPQIGFIGLGRMGANMVRRLTAAGISCVVYDANTEAVTARRFRRDRHTFPRGVAQALRPPRAIWFMVQRRWWIPRSRNSRSCWPLETP